MKIDRRTAIGGAIAAIAGRGSLGRTYTFDEIWAAGWHMSHGVSAGGLRYEAVRHDDGSFRCFMVIGGDFPNERLVECSVGEFKSAWTMNGRVNNLDQLPKQLQ